jgi:cellulose synthase/poly-beta-1,6-N-acetylglucosamine synthase-like glycosyltransferase
LSRFATAAAIAITLIAWAGAMLHDGNFFVVAVREHDWLVGAQAFLYITLVSVLVYGSLVYLFARRGYLERLTRHRPASNAELTAFRVQTVPSVTILVPSYKEGVDVVRKTLLSAALQDYPRRSVVLLIDDPPRPATSWDAQALVSVRQVPAGIEQLLAPIRARTARALAEFSVAHPDSADRLAAAGRGLADLMREVADWFAEQARRHEILDHSDRCFVELTFLSQSRSLRQQAAALERRAEAGRLDATSMLEGYRRLAQRFDVTLRSFERKRYVNLSHEPNKAMNLNSYIGLMGGCFEERWVDGELLLTPATAGEQALAVPTSDYVLVLDADSIIHPEYTVRLAHRLAQPDHHRIAVIQTPYSAFADAPGALERTAAATTDIQYQIHQGFTHYRATFWVGANAMVRMRALQDISYTRRERGFTVPVFIDDRTVIEDTESTIDLRCRGWQLHNYPDRLAFSATPPDFGSLLIQRRRWANGGLLLVPKLWPRAAKAGARRMAPTEALFRLHYLTSLAASNMALLILLACGFDDRLTSAWLPLTAVPYYLLYASDLRRAGHRRRDVLRVYALNLLLVPVSLGGALGSLKQAWTGRRSAFARTPKVVGRTSAPAGYVVAEILLCVSWFIAAVVDARYGRRLNAAFDLGNATIMLYGLLTFIGVRAACADMAPLGRALRLQWLAARVPWPLRAGRLVAPTLIGLLLLLRPAATTGFQVAVTLNAPAAHTPRHRMIRTVGFVDGASSGQEPSTPRSSFDRRWSSGAQPGIVGPAGTSKKVRSSPARRSNRRDRDSASKNAVRQRAV